MASSHKPHRSSGEGSVYMTGDGRLRGALTLPHPVTGKPTRHFVSGHSRAEVVRKFEAIRRAGGFASNETVGDYLARWLTADKANVRPATWRSYEMHVRLYLTPAIGAIKLGRLTPLDVERMTSALVGRGLSARTAAHARAILRRALADAERDGLVVRNVARLARPPRVEQREMRALTPAEVRLLTEATAGDRYGPLYAFAVGTGLRLGEVLGLRWQDVDFEAGTITVQRAMARSANGGFALAEPKTAKSRRMLILPAGALDALRRQRARQAEARLAAGTAWQSSRLVFTDTAGRGLSNHYVSHEFHKAVGRARTEGPVSRPAALVRDDRARRGRWAEDGQLDVGPFDDRPNG